MSRFRWIAVFCILVTPALWQQSCGPTYEPTHPPPPGPEGAQTPTEAPGTTLTFGQWGSPMPNRFCTLGQTTGTDEWWLRRLASATLGTLTPALEWEPELAQSWAAGDDLMTFTFSLRQGVTWHDGVPFTAGDVLFTFDLILDPAIGPYYDLFADVVTRVEAVDGHTVVFHMSHPVNWEDFGWESDFRSLVEGWSPVPTHILTGTSTAEICNTPWATTSYVGLGPYQIVESADQYVRLSPYAGYYGEPATLDKIEVYFSNDPDQLFAGLVTSDMDMVQITPGLVDQVGQYPNLFIPENASLLAVNGDRTDWPPGDPYLYRALIEPQGETFVPYRESLSELGSIIGAATLLPQHPETGLAIKELGSVLGRVRINKARTVSWQGNPEAFHLAPLGPQSAPASADEFWQAVQEHEGFVIGTLVVERDPPPDGGRVQPFAVRVHGMADSPEIQFVRPDGGTEITFTERVTVEVLAEAVDIPTASIDTGSWWCSTRLLGVRIWYPCW